jgi:hypothetical protein
MDVADFAIRDIFATCMPSPHEISIDTHWEALTIPTGRMAMMFQANEEVLIFNRERVRLISSEASSETAQERREREFMDTLTNLKLATVKAAMGKVPVMMGHLLAITSDRQQQIPVSQAGPRCQPTTSTPPNKFFHPGITMSLGSDLKKWLKGSLSVCGVLVCCWCFSQKKGKNFFGGALVL